jgi:hypothetical protein
MVCFHADIMIPGADGCQQSINKEGAHRITPPYTPMNDDEQMFYTLCQWNERAYIQKKY